MGGLIEFLLLVVVLLLLIPALVIANLFSRTRQLRREVDNLQDRLRRMETSDSSRLQAGGPLPVAEKQPAPAREVLPPPVTLPPRGGALPPRVGALPPKGGSSLPITVEQPSKIEQPVAEDSLESRIGERWMLNIGIAAFVIGVAYFEKLAIDKGWINETARVIQGYLVGVALMVLGARFIRKGYGLYGQMMTGGGVAILYVSTFAAFMFYHLIGRGPAYAIMVGVTALGAWLADRHNSQGLAVLAVSGGFMTPFLLHGNTDQQIALFTYVAVMVAGSVYLARRRAWPLLNIVSYLLTLLTIAAWADRYYTPEKYLATELYLTLFCAMFVAIAWTGRRTEEEFGQFVSWFLWTAPVAYYVTSLLVLADHPMAMLVWIIGVALVSGVLSAARAEGAELVVWLAAALPLLAWTGNHASPAWLTPGLVTVAAVYSIALASQLREAGTGAPTAGVQIVWMHLNALMMFAGAYFLLEPAHLAVTGPLAAAFALWQGVLSRVFWTRDRDRAVHFAALGFTLLSIAIALQYDGPAVTIGWAAEGAAIIALGLYVQRNWLRVGGGVLFGIAFVMTLDLLLSVAPANHVVFLNPRAAAAGTVIALAYAIAWLHRRYGDMKSRPAVIAATLVAAQVMSVVLLTREIHAFFAMREGNFTREMMVSVTWAVYATALIVIGLQRRYAPIRYFAIGLFAITIGKVFFSDLAELQRIYRVMSVIALGITLMLTSYLYQKMKAPTDGEQVTGNG